MPDILKYYNSVIRGILNYYSFADNHSSLGMIVHGLKHSCALTLKGKFKLASRAAIFKKYGHLLTYTAVVTNNKGVMSEKKYSLFVPKTFRRLPFKMRFKVGDVSVPNLHRIWNSKFTRSNLWKNCIICGSFPVEMHHLRSLALVRKPTEQMDFLQAQMIAINRKQVPLCHEHHLKVHGKLGGLTFAERENFKSGCSNLIKGDNDTN